MGVPDLISWRALYPPAPLTAADRRMIGKIVEQLIELLDLAAGDVDLEDDDPAGDYLDTCEGEVLLKVLPLYGPDQTKGPINEVAACHAHKLSERAADEAEQERRMALRRRG